jgi:Fe-S oxidoreductase
VIKVLLFALIWLVSFALFCYRGWQLITYLQLGQPSARRGQIGQRLLGVLTAVFGHGGLLRNPYAGLLHLFVFYGFLTLVAGDLLLMAQGFVDFRLPAVVTFVQDLFGLLVLVGVAMALFQRLVLKPERFEGSHESDAVRILLWVMLVIVTQFTTTVPEVALAAGDIAPAAAPISWLFARLFSGLSRNTWQTLCWASWWVHTVLLAGFLPYLLYSKHLHIIVGIPNVFLRALESKGALDALDLDDEGVESFGAARIEALPWKRLLDAYACTECGRRQDACPATMAGTPLNPKTLIMDLRDHLVSVGPSRAGGHNGDGHAPPLAGGVIHEDVLWACTTCRACMEECPLYIEHVPDIVDMRRYLVLEQGAMPDTLNTTLRQAARSGNPWGLGRHERTAWAEGLEVPVLADVGETDLLYWVGCAGSLDPHNQPVSRAMVKILRAAGVDFATLGQEETCNCEWARRAGEEHLFQEATAQIIETLRPYKFQKILTQCPHCFNTFKNDYPQFGVAYEVVHHSRFIARLLREGRLKLSKPLVETITYHDPCYLGRYNDEYDAPRQALGAISGAGLVEMPRSRRRGLCCGGGGAQVWMETEQEEPVSQIRLDEAMSLAPDIVGTACPFCKLMFDDAAGTMGVVETVAIRDIAELVAESL